MPWLTDVEKLQVQKGELTMHEHQTIEKLERNKNLALKIIL